MSARQRREKSATPVTEKDVRLLFNFCQYARYIYRHYKVLLDNDQNRRNLLWNTAPYLFGDINLVLKEYIPLQVCKLTDPEKDVRGNVSLTIEFFLNNSDFSGAPAKLGRLQELSGKIHDFRKHLKPARNKIIAHLDRKTARAGKPLGGVDNDAWNDFWHDLQSFVGILCERYLGETLYINAGDSDAERLVQSLTR